jgi:hypothetical protein
MSASPSMARSLLANAVKSAKAEPSPAAAKKVADARRDLAAAKLRQAIETALSSAPRLSHDQVAALGELLHAQCGPRISAYQGERRNGGHHPPDEFGVLPTQLDGRGGRPLVRPAAREQGEGL